MSESKQRGSRTLTPRKLTRFRRNYLLDCIACAKVAPRLPDEAYGRMLLHLSLIQRELGSKEEADKLQTRAMAILEKYEHCIAPCIREQYTPLVKFDDLQGMAEGRWTGRDLFRHMQGCASCQANADISSGH